MAAIAACPSLPGDERQYFIGYVRSYFKHLKAVPWAAPIVPKMKKSDWAVPQRSKRFSVEYRRTYDKLSASYISLGEAFLGRMLKLHPEV